MKSETYLRLYNQLYGVPYVINRPSSVYGPLQDGSDDGGWVTWFIKAKCTNQMINLYGDGTHTCKELFDLKYKGIILKRELVKCDHPVFDYIEGDGEHTKEELIKIREEKLKPYLYNMFLSIWYETHGDNFED